MKTIIVIGVLIVLAVLLLSILTLNKAYKFEHTVDSIDPLPEDDKTNNENNQK